MGAKGETFEILFSAGDSMMTGSVSVSVSATSVSASAPLSIICSMLLGRNRDRRRDMPVGEDKMIVCNKERYFAYESMKMFKLKIQTLHIAYIAMLMTQ